MSTISPKSVRPAKTRFFKIPLRPLLIGLAILLQLALFVLLVWLLSLRMAWIYSALQLMSFIMTFRILNRQDNPTYKITWIVFILFFPLFGGLLYLLWGGNRVSPGKRRRLEQMQRETAANLPESPEAPEQIAARDPRALLHSRYLTALTSYPLYNDTATRYYAPVETAMPAILEALERARHYIFLEFFILAQGKMWDAIYGVLKKKARQGLDIRIMYDDFGSLERQYRGFSQELEASGIQIKVFNPLKPSIDLFMNNRNHRKMLVVDGVEAFTGGFNIGDEYINEMERSGHWHDSVLHLQGGAAWSFAVMFLSMWGFVTGRPADYSRFLPEKPPAPAGAGFVQPYSDEPLDARAPGKGLYQQLISKAQKNVYIATPYLIIDNELIGALALAAGAGVDVRIVTPHIPDKWYVHPVSQSNYESLLRQGVRIFEYTPGFMHSKLLLSDDKFATVGTVNLDYRSFYFHFECGVYLYDTPSVGEIAEEFDRIFEKSTEITLSAWRSRPRKDAVKQAILRIISPFL